jgi:MFS family permease
LGRFGYRRLLLINTILVGLTIALFATVNRGTAVWVIVAQACCFGFFSSLQYTSMNTLGYADVDEKNTSMASTIMSTVQQLSMSFGVATSSLVAGFFIADRLKATPEQLAGGLHMAFIVLGALTVVSALAFAELKPDDGEAVSLHHRSTPTH